MQLNAVLETKTKCLSLTADNTETIKANEFFSSNCLTVGNIVYYDDLM